MRQAIGNYEGLYRNDNNQSDPSISSLYDFTNGVLGLLGDQFKRGYLNTDRRQTGNLYGSYVIPSGFMKRFSGGIGLRGSAGTPISMLGAHPVYDDAGESRSAAGEPLVPQRRTINSISTRITRFNWVSGTRSSSPLTPLTSPTPAH